MLDWLKTILGEAYTEDIDKKVSAEVGKEFVARTDFNTLNETKKTLEQTIKDRDKQLDDLKKVDAAGLQAEITKLQDENKTAAEKHEQELGAVKLNAALDTAILKAKGKNARAIKALIDVEKLKLKDDGAVEGLDLEALKTSDPYLFEITKTTQQGTGSTGGAGDQGSSEDPPEDYHAYKAWREKQDQ